MLFALWRGHLSNILLLPGDLLQGDPGSPVTPLLRVWVPLGSRARGAAHGDVRRAGGLFTVEMARPGASFAWCSFVVCQSLIRLGKTGLGKTEFKRRWRATAPHCNLVSDPRAKGQSQVDSFYGVLFLCHFLFISG